MKHFLIKPPFFLFSLVAGLSGVFALIYIFQNEKGIYNIQITVFLTVCFLFNFLQYLKTKS